VHRDSHHFRRWGTTHLYCYRCVFAAADAGRMLRVFPTGCALFIFFRSRLAKPERLGNSCVPDRSDGADLGPTVDRSFQKRNQYAKGQRAAPAEHLYGFGSALRSANRAADRCCSGRYAIAYFGFETVVFRFILEQIQQPIKFDRAVRKNPALCRLRYWRWLLIGPIGHRSHFFGYF
jgi:hypothetical protein